MHHFKARSLSGRLCALLIASSGVLVAQTSAVGHISGKVTYPDGKPAVGQLVLLETPRGNREIRTDANGQFLVANLVPGKVLVKVNIKDMMDFKTEVLVAAYQTAVMAIHLMPQAAQTIEVIAYASTLALNTTDPSQAKIGLTTSMDHVDLLPIPVTTTMDRFTTMMTLVPGTNSGYAIHGASTMAFHVDGVDTTDSNFGNMGTGLNNDLMDQIQVLTGGVSAKYGRFDGGVFSVTTKSGSNTFEGSTRMTLSNPKWGGVGKTPEIYKALGIPLSRPLDNTTTIQSYTFMGPIIKDTLFFSLGYQTYSPSQKTAQATNGLTFGSVPYVATSSETRQDFKLDWSVDTSNRLSFQYNAVKSDNTNQSTNYGNPSSLATLSGLDHQERGYYSLGWTSQLSSNLLLDVKYNDAFYKKGGSGTGSTGGDSVVTWLDVPDFTLFDNGAFTSVKEERHQKVFSVGVTEYFNAMGEHQLEAGIESYKFTLESGALDFPSGYLISFNGFTPGASTPALSNRILEVQNPALTSLTWQQAMTGKATTKNHSLYVNDTWTINKNVSLNLGLRYDKFTSDTTPENNHYATDAYAPRLAFNYDLKGDRQDVVTLTAAVYTAQILQGNLANATVTKTPITKNYVYIGTGGPAQGTGADALTSTGAINWAAWGNLAGATGQGNPASTLDPIQNRTTFVDPNLKAPRTREITLGFHHETQKQAFAATLIRRWMDRFVDDIWYGDGIAPGVAKVLISNDPDGKRDYYGLEVTYRNNAIEHLSFGGNVTWGRAMGNDGAQANNFGSGISRDRLAPYGPSFPLDRPLIAHTDLVYRNSLGKGTYNVSLLGSYFGKETYGYRWGVALTDPSLVAQGYAYTYRKYFPELGPHHQPAYFTLDMQIGYEAPFAKWAKGFVKFNINNILNYMPNTMNTYYGTAYTGSYVPFTLVDGLGTVNVPPRSVTLDLGIRF
ncbi:MAG: TonB-dependent receptor [Geothrix sp.]|uniref:TonB-dependent receptor n=1 Tax=Geothrix sp. TaxID=1962974 RepID=UPI00178F01D0|nr:TonB-dependent receptor [Geothrix sp.]NWJ42499.1 TonB-dependent receptor [Geothrix sp.]WIL19539.1 MAG: TonB-dependent receptor [Geothrix sp.]